jgi:hypothetical protein
MIRLTAKSLVTEGNNPKSSKKTYAEFMKQAGRLPLKTQPKKKLEDIRNIFNAAQHLDFDKFLIFFNDMQNGSF